MAKYKLVFNPITGNLDFVNTDVGNIVLDNIATAADVDVGDWVRMQGATAVKAQADSEVNANVIGVCEFKASATVGNIRVLGITEEVFTGLDETLEYYLSATVAGEMTTSPPTTSGHIVLKVGQPYTDKKFLVLKGIRFVRN